MRPNMTLLTTKDPRAVAMNTIAMMKTMIVIMNMKKSPKVEHLYTLIFFISLQMDPSLIDVNKTILKTY